MTAAIGPIMAAPTSSLYESVRVTMYAIEMHATSAISALTAGSVANLKYISIVCWWI
jgi:hypothetical protein